MVLNLIISFLLLSLSISVVANEDKSEAQLTIEVLDAFCIQNQTDFSNITLMAKSSGGKVLPNEMADPVMRELGGSTVYIPYQGRNYLIAYANGGGCSVGTKFIDEVNLKNLLNKHFTLSLLDTQRSLSQANEIFEVKSSGLLLGAIFSITYSLADTGYKDGSISFIPANTVNKATGN
ncbi:hypothetical protein [Agarivorans sp. DSG3-1]|uniref:hypothetical protein n=1 Tax=Agarivorans sp. DSG3-1 TaxID=3342249 RepID=UPI00398EA89B